MLVVLVPLVLDAELPEFEVDLLTEDAGLLTVEVLLVVEDLLALLPTLMPPRMVPVVVLTELDGLFDEPLE